MWSPGSWRCELHIYTPSMCHELPFSICAWRQQRLSLRIIVRSRWVPGKMPGMSWNGIVVRYFIMLAAAAVTIAPERVVMAARVTGSPRALPHQLTKAYLPVNLLPLSGRMGRTLDLRVESYI